MPPLITEQEKQKFREYFKEAKRNFSRYIISEIVTKFNDMTNEDKYLMFDYLMYIRKKHHTLTDNQFYALFCVMTHYINDNGLLLMLCRDLGIPVNDKNFYYQQMKLNYTDYYAMDRLYPFLVHYWGEYSESEQLVIKALLAPYLGSNISERLGDY